MRPSRCIWIGVKEDKKLQFRVIVPFRWWTVRMHIPRNQEDASDFRTCGKRIVVGLASDVDWKMDKITASASLSNDKLAMKCLDVN